MTTQLGVLAKVLALTVLFAAPAAAQAKPQARKPKPAPTRALRVCRAKRVEQKATPSIEPEWRTSAPLLARR